MSDCLKTDVIVALSKYPTAPQGAFKGRLKRELFHLLKLSIYKRNFLLAENREFTEKEIREVFR